VPPKKKKKVFKNKTQNKEKKSQQIQNLIYPKE
jgi:hypothetical protein